MEFTETYRNVTVRLRHQAVHIYNDEHLIRFLQLPGNGSLELSDYLLKRYEQLFFKPLKITRHSLAIEILAHMFADKFAAEVQGFLRHIAPDAQGPLTALVRKVQEATDSIDCGEADIDTNRIIWNVLVPFRQVIYAVSSRS